MPLEKITSLEGLLEEYQNEPALTLAIERYTRPTEENFWKWREMYRIYKSQKTKPAFDLDETIDDNHQLFVWPDDPKFIGYFETEDKGKRDIPTQMRVGKYLAKFYGQHYDNEKIKAIVSDHLFLHSPPILKFAEDDPDLIEHIYENGPKSCMVRSRGYVEGNKTHPVRAYASPDIGLAYIEKGDRFTARTVYNRKTRAYTRIYGDSTMLTSMLKEAGFHMHEAALRGCRLLRTPLDPTDPNIVLMPYLDGRATRIMNDPDDPQHFLKITDDASYPSGGITGGRLTVKAWNWCQCSHCQGDTTRDYVVPAHGYTTPGICPSCASKHFILAINTKNESVLAKRTDVVAIGTKLYVDQKTADKLHGKTVFAEDLGHIPIANTVKLHNGRQGAKHLTIEATAVPDIAANQGDVTRVYAHTMNDNGRDWSVDPFAEERSGKRYRFVPHTSSNPHTDLMPTAVRVADTVLPHLVPYLPTNHVISEVDIAQALTRVYNTSWIPGHDPFLTTLLDLYYQLHHQAPVIQEVDIQEADLRAELTAVIAA